MHHDGSQANIFNGHTLLPMSVIHQQIQFNWMAMSISWAQDEFQRAIDNTFHNTISLL